MSLYNCDYLYHHGILGMHWGIRRYQNKDGSLTAKGKKHLEELEKQEDKIRKEKELITGQSHINDYSSAKKMGNAKSIDNLTDDELRGLINRMRLEQDYYNIVKQPSSSKNGKKFVQNVLENAGKNIATQATAYLIGESINKLAGKEIVNPKKGQKDK